MRAVVIQEHGGYDRLRFEEVPKPDPGPGEVRVAVKAIGVNHLDTWVRRGVPGHVFPLPMIPGCDGAGVVDALGPGVTTVKTGDRVVIAPGFTTRPDAETARGLDQLSATYGIWGETQDGTCAEFVVVPERNALTLPAGLPFETAAAFPLVYLTAWTMLVRRARFEAGESILVHAAGSGVSTASIQIARLLGAGRILATTSNPEKAERARALGADEVLDYTDGTWSRQAKEKNGGRPLDVVIDHVGQATFLGSLKCLAKGGRLVTCGATSGPTAEVPLNLVFFKSLSVLGSTMGSLGDVHRLLGLVAGGRLAPVIDSVLPLAEVAEAHRRIEERQVFGKIVLVPDGR
jgi:NADPH:quinone reductase-like Zn-dependent oxidoreductase